MSNIRPILTDLDEVCELLQEAEKLMQLSDVQPIIENIARGLAQIKAIRSGTIELFDAGDVCRAVVMMAAVDPTTDIDRWPLNVVSQVNRFVQMHEVIDSPNGEPFEQAAHRISVAIHGCKEMGIQNVPQHLRP